MMRRALILPVMLALALGVPGTALADADRNRAVRVSAFAPPDGGCKDGKCEDRGERGGKLRFVKPAGEDAAFRVYALLTGKGEAELRKACESRGISVWKLAELEGRLQALKDRLLAGHVSGLDAMVKSGVMTQEQRSEIIGHLKEKLDGIDP